MVTGCAVSPILFVMGMNLIITAARKETSGPMMDSGVWQPTIWGFFDDLTTTTSTHVQAKWVLTKLGEVVSWARMSFKTKKNQGV